MKRPLRRKLTRSKIVVTLGPACDSPSMIEQFIHAGVDVFRLNFSHGSHEKHAERIKLIKNFRHKLNAPVAIMADLSGPKMRIGYLNNSPMELKRGMEVHLVLGQHAKRNNEIPFPNREMMNNIDEGKPVLLQDGNIQIIPVGITPHSIRCKVKTTGLLYSEQGIYFPMMSRRLPAITSKDKNDIKFCVGQGIDFFAVSFVQSPEDIITARRIIEKAGGTQHIIAKIEKPEALKSLKDIVTVADGCMVARGDLGVEIPLENVPFAQKEIIQICNQFAKPVITATQMLESMTERPRPTRAEVTDVANSILDGTDAIMLSGETAVGKNPLKAVKTMEQIARTTEKHYPFNERVLKGFGARHNYTPNSIGRAACMVASELSLDAIVCCTHSGSTARLISSFRPQTPVLGVTITEATYYHLAVSWGVLPVMAGNIGLPGLEAEMGWMVKEAIQSIKKEVALKNFNRVVITAGVPLLTPGTTNFIRVVDI